jgi:hypothetical protein
MTEEKVQYRRPADTSKVQIGQDWEVKYWSDRFGVSRDKLRNAVATAGSDVEAVRSLLRKR